MPAKSKAQKKFMQMVAAVQSGNIPKNKVSKKMQDVAAGMKHSDVKKFTKTPADDLPNKT
jgi:hypothetical protein